MDGDGLGFLLGDVGMGSGKMEVGTRPVQEPVVPVAISSALTGVGPAPIERVWSNVGVVICLCHDQIWV